MFYPADIEIDRLLRGRIIGRFLSFIVSCICCGLELTIRRASPLSTSTHPAEYSDPWWSTYVRSYERICPADLPPNTAFGVRFDTFTIEVQTYLAYLLRRIKSLGGQVTRARLPADKGFVAAVEVASDVLGLLPRTRFWAVINASGLQSRDLVKDTTLYPIRGQIVQVRGVANYCITRLGVEENQRIAVMPRPTAGITVIGVTVEPDVASTEIDQARVPELLNAAKPYCPELLDGDGEFDIASIGVGIRPGRRGGARIELEEIDDLKVVHAYGVAGAGYQNSIGIARKVLKLLS